MFINIPVKAQIEILAIKINEVEMSGSMTADEKNTIKQFYRKKLKKIDPKSKL